MSRKPGVYAVLASVCIQMTLGIAYIWSLFQNGIANSLFNGNHASAQLTFSLLLATLTVGGALGGKLGIRYGTRRIVFIGGLVLSLGFLGASFVPAQWGWLLWITYGIMGGLGMGFTYSTTIACAQKWYPHRKGMITGIIVSSLGLGGVMFSPAAQWLLVQFGGVGYGEQSTFRVLAIVFFVVCTVGSLFCKNPPEGWRLEQAAAKSNARPIKNYTPMQMLKSIKFYLCVTTFAVACMGGLMMIGFVSPILQAHGFNPDIASFGVLVVSMFNAIGRLGWSWLSDKLGRKNTIMLMLGGSAVLSLLVGVISGGGVFVLVAFIGLCYGGVLGTFPVLTADLFGPKHMASNYGFVLLGFGAGAIAAGQISGHFNNLVVQHNGDIRYMFPAFIIASACALTGVVLMQLLKWRRKVDAKKDA
ncbi:MAG: OFA family MFS transporter [Oscillospiraceae bacterium]|nr:OFA family MFS transporter [Oscillospiraceae bacterium]